MHGTRLTRSTDPVVPKGDGRKGSCRPLGTCWGRQSPDEKPRTQRDQGRQPREAQEEERFPSLTLAPSKGGLLYQLLRTHRQSNAEPSHSAGKKGDFGADRQICLVIYLSGFDNGVILAAQNEVVFLPPLFS